MLLEPVVSVPMCHVCADTLSVTGGEKNKAMHVLSKFWMRRRKCAPPPSRRLGLGT